MVSLLCCCCKDLYVPNFRLGRNSHIVEDTIRFNNVLYNRFSCGLGGVVARVATPTLPSWFSDYLYINCVFHLLPGDYNNYIVKPFPFSSYDYIRIDYLKPKYLGVNVGSHLNVLLNGFYDTLEFSWSSFTPDKISETLDIIMSRFNPLFSPQYFYYSDDGRDINRYSVHYSYDEFLSAFRSWLYRFFIDFYKNGSLYAFSPYGYVANKGQFTIERELI